MYIILSRKCKNYDALNVTRQLNTIEDYTTIKQYVHILPGFDVFKTRKRVKSS